MSKNAFRQNARNFLLLSICLNSLHLSFLIGDRAARQRVARRKLTPQSPALPDLTQGHGPAKRCQTYHNPQPGAL